MYQYKQSGLDNVWLVNGFEVISTPYGNAVKFENANELLEEPNALASNTE